MKETQMTFRIDPKLRAAFSAAAESQYRPAAQVLRDLMRDYVVRTEQPQTIAPKISQAERKRREIAFNYARASVGLEGLKVTEEYQAEVKRFINGDIDFSELTKALHEQVRNR